MANSDQSGDQMDCDETEVRECPFPDCDWEREWSVCYEGELSVDHAAEMHYEEEHAGRVKIHVKLEKTQLLGGRDLQDISDAVHEELSEEMPKGFAVSWTAAEEIEPADDHEVLQDDA